MDRSDHDETRVSCLPVRITRVPGTESERKLFINNGTKRSQVAFAIRSSDYTVLSGTASNTYKVL